MNNNIIDSFTLEDLDLAYESINNNNELAPLSLREKAIREFKKNYLGRYHIEYFPENTDNKHDKIIAEITYSEDEKNTAEKYISGLMPIINRKSDKFTYMYRDDTSDSKATYLKRYIFANPKIKKETKKKESKPTKENTVTVDIHNSESDLCGLFVDDFKRIPIVEGYISKYNLKADEAVNVLENYVIANPFHVLDLMEECMFKSEEEYDNALTEAFINIIENSDYTEEALQSGFISAMNRDIATMEDASIIRKKVTDAGKAVKKAITGAPNPKTMRSKFDKKVNTAKGVLSPIAKKIRDTVEELIGDEAERREIIKGGIQRKLLKIRRIFLKLISLYALKNALFAMVVPGGLILRIVTYLGTLGALTYTAFKTVADSSGSNTRSAIIGELELELKITREKIEDAKSKGDTKAKYELMRIENKIEEEIFRVKYNKSPKRHAH